MQTQLILVLGVFLGSCLPADGQKLSVPLDFTHDLSQKRSGPGMTLLAASSNDFPLPPVMPARSFAENPVRFPVVVAVVPYLKPNLKLPSRARAPVEINRTPFIRQGRVLLVQLLGGRLQLDGFGSVVSMKTVLYGPLTLGQPGTMQPRDAGVYGISLSFRLGRDASLEGSRLCGLLAILFACKDGDARLIQKSEPL